MYNTRFLVFVFSALYFNCIEALRIAVPRTSSRSEEGLPWLVIYVIIGIVLFIGFVMFLRLCYYRRKGRYSNRMEQQEQQQVSVFTLQSIQQHPPGNTTTPPNGLSGGNVKSDPSNDDEDPDNDSSSSDSDTSSSDSDSSTSDSFKQGNGSGKQETIVTDLPSAQPSDPTPYQPPSYTEDHNTQPDNDKFLSSSDSSTSDRDSNSNVGGTADAAECDDAAIGEGKCSEIECGGGSGIVGEDDVAISDESTREIADDGVDLQKGWVKF